MQFASESNKLIRLLRPHKKKRFLDIKIFAFQKIVDIKDTGLKNLSLFFQ